MATSVALQLGFPVTATATRVTFADGVREHQDEVTMRVEADGPKTRLAGTVADSVREVTRLRAVVDILPPGTLGPMRRDWSI